MSTGAHCETERKYLIRYPEKAVLERQPGCERWDIRQTYLTDGEDGATRRVRIIECNGELRYFRTYKRRISAMSCAEDEGEITREVYEALLRERDERRSAVIKTRYRIPHGGHIVELDIYPFWQDRAIMEIELSSEDETARIPDYIQVIRDVTGEKAYKNKHLARSIPMEEI